MSVLNTLPTPVIQMGLVEKIADLQQNQPYALLHAGQEASREALKADSQRIGEVHTTEHGKKVRDKEKQERREAGDQSRDEHDASDTQDDDHSEQRLIRANPWAGNILNVKI